MGINTWPMVLLATLNILTAGDGIKWEENSEQRIMATSGATVAIRKSSIDSELASIPLAADYILCNFGANDVTDTPNETYWNTNYQYIIDALHAKWPTAKIYLAKAWRRNYDAWCDTLAGRIDTLIAANPGVCFAGHDERVWLEGGDNGVTMTVDGVHYSTAGEAECAAQWQTILGY
jgi:lysophospholipase L1-like esterase